jgi:parallel beta-helix repeat protein
MRLSQAYKMAAGAFVFLFFFLFLSKNIFAAGNSYYVSPSGSNSNPGTLASPFLTVQKAVNTVGPGDTIYLRAGTYSESVHISVTGTSGGEITLTSYSGETATINGGSNMALYVTNTAISYWTIDGINIKSSNRYATRWGWYGEKPTSHITVKNNTIYGANYIVGSYHLWEKNNIDGTGYAGTDGDGGICDGIGSNNNIYRNNTVHDFKNSDGRGIWTQNTSHDILIENNNVYNINGSGLGQCIDLDGAATMEYNNIVRGNTVSGCSYVGIQLENVFASTIENNNINGTGASAGIIDINYDSGVGCTAAGGYGDTNGDHNCRGDDTQNIFRQNVIWTTGSWGWGYGGIMNWYAGGMHILGNTIYAAGSSGNGGINFQGTASQTGSAVIEDNILTNNNGAAICALDYASFATDDYNLLYKTNNDGVYATGTACDASSTMAQYKSATGKAAHSITGNPLWTNSGSHDFTLTSASSAIDHGTNIGTAADIAGNTRPSGAAYDIGAYEFKGTGTSTIAPTPTTVPTATPIASTPTPTPTAKPGDANLDGVVNEADYTIWLAHFGQTVTGGAVAGDFNSNGKVDGVDYVIWLINYGK